METSAFKSVVNQVTLIDDTAWDDFEQYFSKRTLRKNELLWAAGDVCRHLVFINYGMIRSFRYANAKEVSNQFFFEDSIFYDDFSFVSQKPCVNSYEALEETEMIVIPRVAVNLMYDKNYGGV